MLVSCSSVRDDYSRPTYINNENYKNCYIVDTIKIENPIRFYTSRGEYIMPEDKFETYKFSKNDNDLLINPYTFLYAKNYPMIIGDFLDFDLLLDEKFPALKSKIYDAGYENFNNVKEISAYKFKKEPDFFVLLFIRADYYNLSYIGTHGPTGIKTNKKGNMFYRLVIPYSTLN
jgi:hypothetical protein